MKRFAKLALGALLLAGATAITTAPADARVTVGIGIGIPGPYYGPHYYYGPPRYSGYCDPYGPYYDPYYCDDYAPVAYWYDPVFIDGVWVRGPFRWHWDHGRRAFWVHGGWRYDEWHGGPRPDFRGWHDRDWHDRGWHDRDWRGDHDWHGGDHDWHRH